MPRKGFRATHCKNGHERSAENVDSKGYCRTCSKAYYKKWRDTHKAEGRAAARKWKYGVTQETFDSLMSEQENKCAICDKEFDLTNKRNSPHVDHSHIDGSVRGLLCDSCNKGLGNFGDSLRSLREAAVYIERYQPKQEEYGSNKSEPEGLTRGEESINDQTSGDWSSNREYGNDGRGREVWGIQLA